MSNVVTLDKRTQAKGRMAEKATKPKADAVDNDRIPTNVSIAIKDIAEGDNPRSLTNEAADRELVGSIKRHGVLQPIRVRPAGRGKYEVVAGHRRLAAAKEAKLTTIPVFIATPTDDDAYVQSLVENIQRENLNPIDEAKAFVRLLAGGKMSQKELGKIVHKSQPYISNAMRLLETSPKVQEALAERRLNVGAAKAIAALPAEEQDKIAERAEKGKLTDREVEAQAAEARRQAEWKEREAAGARQRLENLNTLIAEAVKAKSIPKDATLLVDVYGVDLAEVTVPKTMTVMAYDWNNHHPHTDRFTCACKAWRLSPAGVVKVCLEPDHFKAWKREAEAAERAKEKARREKVEKLRRDMAPLLAASETQFSEEGIRLLAYGVVLSDQKRALTLMKRAKVEHPKVANYETIDGKLFWDAIVKTSTADLVTALTDLVVERYIPDVYHESQWVLEKGAHLRQWMVDTLGADKEIVWGGREAEFNPQPDEQRVDDTPKEAS